MSRSVGIVVLNWNNGPDTLLCLESIARMDRAYTLVVVDNGSTDGSAETVARAVAVTWPPASTEEGASAGARALFVQAGRNGGYAAGNNHGLRLLRRLGVDVAWILNNDVVVAPDALARIEAHLDAEPGPFLAGTLVLEWGAPERIECAGGARFSWATSRSRWVGRGEPRGTAGAAPIDYVSGASMLVSLDALARTGLLDESFFLYFEEIDLAHRATSAGIPLRTWTDVVVLHKGGSTTGTRRGWRQRSPASVVHSCRSAVVVTRRHRPWLVPSVVTVRVGFAAALALRGCVRQAAAALGGTARGLAAPLRDPEP